MKKLIKYFTRDTLRLIFGPKLYSFIRFYIVHGYKLSWDNPKSFSHKIIHRKFDEHSLEYSKYVDKYTVRKYVEDCIGSEYLIPLLAKHRKLTPTVFESLPDSFVMKTSNGGGGENVLIVEDKNQLDYAALSDKFNSFLDKTVGKPIDEEFYDIEVPCVVFEKLIKHTDGSYPSDYKFHIFNNGIDTTIYIQVDTGRFTDHRRSIFDINLNRTDFSIQPKYSPVSDDFSFPSNIFEVASLAKKLSEPFPYVRIDMYSVDDKIYFGELTFCHGSGWEPISPQSADFMLGSLWKEFEK